MQVNIVAMKLVKLSGDKYFQEQDIMRHSDDNSVSYMKHDNTNSQVKTRRHDIRK